MTLLHSERYFRHMASTTHILNRAPGMAGQLLLNLRDASKHEDRAAFRWNMQADGT